MNLIQSVNIESAKLYNPGLNYMSYLTPGLWAALLHQIFVIMGALSWCPEIENKRWQQMNQCSLLNLFLGKILFYVFISVILLELFFRILYPAFNIAIQVPIGVALIFSILFAITSISLGTLISIQSKTTVGALKIVILITSPAFILSGYTWPRSQMPVFYQYLSELLPLTSYLEGFRKLYQEQASIVHVTKEIFILSSLCIIMISISWKALQKKKIEWDNEYGSKIS